ncbi:MAG: hypothetical protein KBF42_09350 [Chitinophagales bacterium]|nr:hypothetical protein [Bacteroidota bacterium]MBP7400429.1 hypothetical protein [Chitinophagales bacterium]MBK8681692.1 hypothetical protein [Bacteroidota bacterium]MBP8755071.1 hypothetical protein [Chitinophagales bacterium]MBP9221580.1 hypothetical protein [Chitinophagales bacterium]
MKKIQRFFIWVLGLFLIILSLGGFANGDNLVATLCFVAGLLILPPVFKRLFHKKQNQTNTTSSTKTISKETLNEKISFDDVFKISTENTGKNEMTTTLGFENETKLLPYLEQNERENQDAIKNFNYIPQQVIAQAIQTCESIYIMYSTKNFDTLKGRSEFVKIKLNYLNLASHHKRYIADVQTALDQYKIMYYDRIPTEVQITSLIKPNEFDFPEFYCQCLIQSFEKFYEEQNKQISFLKREDAIKNRRENIMDTIREFQLNIPIEAISFSEVNHQLETIYQKVYEDTFGFPL